MAKKTAVSKRKKENGKRPRLDFRFADQEHKELAERAAKKDGGSINAWIVRVTLRAAREELGEED
jgi:uncharacterized protein (DUF1778 family)